MVCLEKVNKVMTWFGMSCDVPYWLLVNRCEAEEHAREWVERVHQTCC